MSEKENNNSSRTSGTGATATAKPNPARAPAAATSESDGHGPGAGGRKKDDNPVRLFFAYDPARDQSNCVIPDCPAKKKGVPGNHSGNMKKHLKRWHKDRFKDLEAEEERLAAVKGESRKRNAAVLNNVQMTPSNLKRCCVRLVTVHGRPFTSMNDEAFQDLVNPYLEAMPLSERFSISDRAVRDHVDTFADEIRQKISNEVKGKFICLKVDSTSKNFRHFFAVNVQFISDGTIQLRTLAVREMLLSQTAKNLKHEILDILDLYRIDIRFIYSFTSDNGSNMLKAAELLKQHQEELSLIGDPDSEENEDTENLGELLEDEDLQLVLTSGDFRLQSVRCVAHTVQLGVEDSLKTCQRERSVIDECRKAARTLRTPTARRRLTKEHLPVPVLDNDTRWDTKLAMASSIRALKNFISENYPEDVKLSDEDWLILDTIIEALSPVKVATKKFQDEQLTLGDMYGAWLTCKIQISKVDSDLARSLLTSMEKREKRQLNKEGNEKSPPLFEYPGFLAALFFDPRYFTVLSDTDISNAKQHLLTLWTHMESMEKEHLCLDLPLDSAPEEVLNSSEEEIDEVEAFLRSKDAVHCMTSARAPIMDILSKYHLNTKRIPRKENVLKFWESQRFVSPELYKLAQVVLAVPATQVSVERLFSSLRFIVNPLRFSLTSEMVDNVLVVHSNDIFMKKTDEAHSKSQTAHRPSKTPQRSSSETGEHVPPVDIPASQSAISQEHPCHSGHIRQKSSSSSNDDVFL